ncbi:response regulator [Actinoplanes sp. NPDC049599]|uniref:response regulator transcription factor n=1 Tax=Actinoplanes sp. NPDC049599 TaxID=3363903 RepID=UPI0037B768F2
MIRVAIIDNDKMVPAGLRALLAGTGDIQLVHSATTVDEHLAAAPGADVVLLDLRLEDGSDPAGNVAKLRGHGERVLVFSVHGDRRQVRATVRAGAGGYLIKDDDAAKIVDAVRSVHRGQLALTAELMSIINDDPPELSPQEARALYLYGTGSTLAATAHRMGVTLSTVRSYLTRVRTKWAAIEEPVDDVRTLVHEYQPRPDFRTP